MTGVVPGGAEGAALPITVGHEGRVVLRGLRTLVHLGVGAGERCARQPVRLTVTLGVDVVAAARADRIERTVDYGAVAEEIAGRLASGEWKLLESLAVAVARSVLDGFEGVAWVEVEVAKLRPPVPLDLEEAAVVLRVDREQGLPKPPQGPGPGVPPGARR